MELFGVQHVFQACGVIGEMEKGGCPMDEEQQLKEALNQCEPVEKRWEPGDGKRLGRVTEACAEGDMFSAVSETVQTTTCGCSRKQCASELLWNRSSQPLSLSGSGSNVKLRKCASWQVLVPVTVPVLIIIATLATFLAVEKSKPPLAAPASLAGSCCPEGWIGYLEKCYYFSETEGNWTYSQSQCSSFSASLAGIDSEQNKSFLLLYKGFSDRWIGLQRELGQPWRWPNGTEFDLRFPIRGGGDCAYMSDENWVSSSRCGTKRLWVCSKPDVLTKGEGT
ncbi:C-type lectin domain family 2 member D-like [Emydura macquarii macquarii]|uniref:C-type lectin domain family 2 member D-like n=1 Tax=Emydura macquarii macquarii TaxID=1129001 RepID=UPI00352AB95E